MYYSSNEQDTPDMTGKAFESHLREKDTAKKAKEEKEKEGGTLQKRLSQEKLSQLGKRDRRIAEKCISDVLFKVEMQSEREEPVNYQMMYGSYGNNSHRNVNTTPLQGQSYMEMLNNPLQKYFVIIIYTLGII